MRSIFSPALSCVPFAAHNDGNRLQMAANFLRQGLTLVSPELPYVSTPYLRKCTLASSFLVTAPEDVEIVYRDEELIVYKSLQTGRVRMYRLPNSLWVPTYKDIVKAGEPLVVHSSIKIERYCSGANLKVLFAPYFGWNYEDAVVLTESGAAKLNTRYVTDYEVMIEPNEVLLTYPEVGKFYRKGDVLFEWTVAPRNIVNVLCSSVDRRRICAETDLVVERITTYYKDDNVLAKHSSSDTVIDWIVKHNRVKRVKEELKNIDSKLVKLAPLYYTENYELVGYPDVVYIQLKASVVKKFDVGDKIGNRHGNKGVCSLIVSDKEVQSEDGWVPDIILNPLGVISRMNIGQIYEMHFAEVCRVVASQLRAYIENEDYDRANSLLVEFEKDSSSVIPYLHLSNIDTVERLKLLYENGLTVELPLYTKNVYKLVRKLCEKYKVPITREWRFGDIRRDYGCGTMYIIPLVHTVESKFSARADGTYHIKTLQPTESENCPAGQRLGEMEIWNFLAYNAVNNIVEILGFKADDVVSKEVMIARCLRNGEVSQVPESIYVNHTLYLYLYALGLTFNNDMVVDESRIVEKCIEWGEM